MKLAEVFSKNEDKIIELYKIDTLEKNKKFQEDFNKYLKSYGIFIPDIETIHFCLKNEYTLPLATLTFKIIDNLSWINTGVYNTSKDFKTYCKKYIINKIDDDMTAEELWSSRCGLLHTNTYESRDVNENKVKQVIFYSGDITSDELISSGKLDAIDHDNYRFLNIAKLAVKTIESVKLFFTDMILEGNMYKVLDKIQKMPLTNIFIDQK
ncbi:MAG: hypothetical protein ACOCQD_04450 [archaeon]